MATKTLTALMLLMLAFVGCSDRTVSDNGQSGAVDSLGRPDSEISGATMYLYTRGEKTTEIRADRIVRFVEIDSTMAYVLDVDFLDSLGEITSTLVGDSGIIREGSEYMEVYGHVVVETRDSMRLDTDFLVWDPKIDKIHTDAFVTITMPERTVSGWGLEAPRDLSRFRILSQISGDISNLEAAPE